MKTNPGFGLRVQASLLGTESQQDYEHFRTAIHDEIAPNGPIEALFVQDKHSWEIQRLRDAKTQLIKISIPAAINRLLNRESDITFPLVQDYGSRWFEGKQEQAKILEQLACYGLDEKAIIAQAIKMVPENEALDRRLAALEVRRSKTFRDLAEFRDIMAGRARPVSPRVIEGSPALANQSGKTS